MKYFEMCLWRDLTSKWQSCFMKGVQRQSLSKMCVCMRERERENVSGEKERMKDKEKEK